MIESRIGLQLLDLSGIKYNISQKKAASFELSFIKTVQNLAFSGNGSPHQKTSRSSAHHWFTFFKQLLSPPPSRYILYLFGLTKMSDVQKRYSYFCGQLSLKNFYESKKKDSYRLITLFELKFFERHNKT